MSTTPIEGPCCESADGLKIRVYRVRLTAWAQRFSDKVDASGGPDSCWPWSAARDRHGYGQFNGPRGSQRAHRLAYELAVGPVPRGIDVRHFVCGNPPCCNPAHLLPGTRTENMADAIRMGRTTKGSKDASSKLTEAQVAEIKRRRSNGEEAKRLAREFGVRREVVSRICNGHAWTHVEGSLTKGYGGRPTHVTRRPPGRITLRRDIDDLLEAGLAVGLTPAQARANVRRCLGVRS